MSSFLTHAAFDVVAWLAAGLIALGAVVGGQVGATVGRRVPAPWLRALVVLVGVVAIVAIVLDW